MAPAQGWHAKSWSVPHFVSASQRWCQRLRKTARPTFLTCFFLGPLSVRRADRNLGPGFKPQGLGDPDWKNSSPCQWKCPDLSIFGCPHYVVQLAQWSSYIMIVKSTLTPDAESFCPKINLNTKLHVFASIWYFFQLNWLGLKNIKAILVSPTW